MKGTPYTRQFFHFGIILLALLVMGVDVAAQTKRPKIGLVLSGGGAKGFAHIGVLKALEEAGITPDYITGTSMGSIVGGLYAAGYSADELRDIVEQSNWTELLSNDIPFNQVVYEEKAYTGRYLLSFPFKDNKLQLPKGLIEGQALMQVFSNLTLPVHDIKDFSKLPIPFACVASDIVTGEPVVLNKGSLALAMRASMSIPSVFTPVRIDGHLLVDGGIMRNMPVQEVIDMGADIVIGVFVTTDLEPEASLTSAISIITQSAFLGTAADTRAQLAKCDILIKPDITGVSTGSFELASTILKRGDDAGNAYKQQFKKLADSLKEFGPMHHVVRPNQNKSFDIHTVAVNGVSNDMADFVKGKLAIQSGQAIAIDELNDKLKILYGTQYFEKLWFEIVGSPATLRVTATEQPNVQMRFAYHYDLENKGGILGNITIRNRLLNHSRLIGEVNLAVFPRVTVDYLKYLTKSQKFAVQLLGEYAKNELPTYNNEGSLTSVFQSRSFAGTARLQTTSFLSQAFGVEATWATQTLKPKVADSNTRSISSLRYNHTTLSLFHRFDNTNTRYFPTQGVRSEVKLSITPSIQASALVGDSLRLDDAALGTILYTSDIYAFDLTVIPFIPVSNKISLLGKLRLKASNLPDDLLNLDNYDFIGGFAPALTNGTAYFGAGIKEFMSANYIYTSVGAQYNVYAKWYLQLVANYLGSQNVIRWTDAEPGKFGNRDNRFGYKLSVGCNSMLGPLSVSLAKDHHRNQWKVGLVIGFYQ